MALIPYYRALQEVTGCEPPGDLLTFVREAPSELLAMLGFLQETDEVEKTLWYCDQDTERPWLEAGFLPFLSLHYLFCLIGMKEPFAGLIVIDPTRMSGLRGIHFSSFANFRKRSRLDQARDWHDWAEALIHEQGAADPALSERVEVIRDVAVQETVDNYIAGLLPRLLSGHDDPVSDEYVAFYVPACSQAMAEELLKLGERPFDQFYIRQAAAERLRRLGAVSALPALEAFVSLRRELPRGYVEQHIQAGERAIISIKSRRS